MYIIVIIIQDMTQLGLTMAGALARMIKTWITMGLKTVPNATLVPGGTLAAVAQTSTETTKCRMASMVYSGLAILDLHI